MRKFALLAGVSVIALVFAQPAAAGEFADLCGMTLTEDTEIKNVTDTVAGSCEIILADGVKLEIKNSDITVDDFLEILAATMPTDNTASVEIKGTTFDVGDDFDIRLKSGKVEIEKDKKTGNGSEIMAGSNMSIDTTDGKIEIKESSFDINETLSISASGEGKVEVKDNTKIMVGDDLAIDSNSGPLEVKGNYLDLQADLTISSESGDVEVKKNMSTIVADSIRIKSTDGDVEVKDNTLDDFDGNLFIGSVNGDVEVKDNDFGSPNTTTVKSDNGDCETEGNTPELTCEAP